jgi:hypothetical protein
MRKIPAIATRRCRSSNPGRMHRKASVIHNVVERAYRNMPLQMMCKNTIESLPSPFLKNIP